MAWRRSTRVRRHLRGAYVREELRTLWERPRVAFVCAHNSARSQMAEGLLRALAGDRFEVRSAGLSPTRVHPFAVVVMKERGIDIGGQRAKRVDELVYLDAPIVVTLCDDAAEQCPVIPGESHRMHWPVPDPAAVQGDGHERLAAFRAARDEIERHIGVWLASLDELDLALLSG
jgi:arsenate reductase (thioredoxin)